MKENGGGAGVFEEFCIQSRDPDGKEAGSRAPETGWRGNEKLQLRIVVQKYRLCQGY